MAALECTAYSQAMLEFRMRFRVFFSLSLSLHSLPCLPQCERNQSVKFNYSKNKYTNKLRRCQQQQQKKPKPNTKCKRQYKYILYKIKIQRVKLIKTKVLQASAAIGIRQLADEKTNFLLESIRANLRPLKRQIIINKFLGRNRN